MSENILQVEGRPGLIRDRISSAVINTNEKDRLRHLQRKRAALSKEQRLDTLEKEILELKAQVKLLSERIK